MAGKIIVHVGAVKKNTLIDRFLNKTNSYTNLKLEFKRKTAPGGKEAINAGDKVLPESFQFFIRKELKADKAPYLCSRRIFTTKDIDFFNQSLVVVVGGGGLILSDTYKNDVSDWQWGISSQLIQQISAPLLVMAIGYNVFRGQREFLPQFNDTITELVKKASFFSLRHNGDIEKLKKHLPQELHSKLKLHFCPTIEHNFKYYKHFSNYKNKNIGFLLAGDRLENRHKNLPRFVEQIKLFKEYLEKNNYKVVLITHSSIDRWILKHLDFVDKIDLQQSTPENIYKTYSQFEYILSDRGHGQMLPFATGCKVISPISHDKLKFFLEDINFSEYGIEESNDNLAELLIEKFSDLQDTEKFRGSWEDAKHYITNVNSENIKTIKQLLAN